MKFCDWMGRFESGTVDALGVAHERESGEKARRYRGVAEVTVRVEDGRTASFRLTNDAIDGMDECLSWLAAELFRALAQTPHHALRITGFCVISAREEGPEGTSTLKELEAFSGEYMSSGDFFDGIHLESASGRSVLRIRPKSR